MTRLLGFLSGLLLVVAAIGLALAVLRYPPAEEPTGPAPVPVAETAPATEREPVAPPTEVETLPRVDDTPPAPATVADATDAEEGMPGDADPPDPVTAELMDVTGDEPRRQWHAFWQPFRSEISAEGFRRRLEGVTGLDYRVVSPRPGEYQVAFAYSDEAERQANLAAIEAATGLVLRSGML